MSDLDLPLAVRMMQDGYLMEIQDLKEKNEQLRELVRDMWTCILTADKSDNAWDECPRCSLWNGNNNHRCEFNRRMKELGVEV